MEVIIPWKELTAIIAPHYPHPKGAGRRPIGLKRMLRIYFMQHWFNLSEPGAEESLYDMESLRWFAGIDLGRNRFLMRRRSASFFT
jgi:IS5 family transposase